MDADATRAPILWKLVLTSELYKTATQGYRLYQGTLYDKACDPVREAIPDNHHKALSTLLLATHDLDQAKHLAQRAQEIAMQEDQQQAAYFLIGEIARAVRGDDHSMPDSTVIEHLHDRVTAQLAADEKRRAAKASDRNLRQPPSWRRVHRHSF